MKTIKLLLIAALCAVSTLVLADPKTDFVNAIAACAAANPDPQSAERGACDRAAIDAYLASKTGQQAVARAVKAKKK